MHICSFCFWCIDHVLTIERSSGNRAISESSYSKCHWLNSGNLKQMICFITADCLSPLFIQSNWVGVSIIHYVSVSKQWKHTLWDGKSLAWHFSCCGQGLPWQVSLSSYFVFSDIFIFLCLIWSYLFLFFSKRYGLKPNDQILAEDRHKVLWVKSSLGQHVLQ